MWIVLPLEKLIFCKNNNNKVIELQKGLQMGKRIVRLRRKFLKQTNNSFLKPNYKRPTMNSMIDNNHNANNEYLSSQVNNFWSKLSTLKSERD